MPDSAGDNNCHRNVWPLNWDTVAAYTETTDTPATASLYEKHSCKESTGVTEGLWVFVLGPNEITTIDANA